MTPGERALRIMGSMVLAHLSDPDAIELLRRWRQALAERRAAGSDPHRWANAEMAVRYWRLVTSDARAARPRVGRSVSR